MSDDLSDINKLGLSGGEALRSNLNILTTRKKHIPPIDRIRNPSIQLPCSLSKMVVGGVIYRLGYNAGVYFLWRINGFFL